jgi:S1-C subfamily serine protease
MKTAFVELSLIVAKLLWLASTASAQVVLVSPQREPVPTLAPHDCYCGASCKCDPCECNVAAAKPQASVKKTYTPAEASVQVRCSKGNEAYQCSGTAIDSQTVLTCAHVLRNGWLLTVDGKPAKLLRVDHKSDVALLTTEHQLKPVPVASVAPKANESVTAYGYERGRKGLWRFPSRVTRLNRYIGFPNQSILGRPAQGRSGGGLFNSAGELVGVCSAADGQEGLYCGLDAIKAILNPSKSTGLKPNLAAKTTPFFLQDCPDGQCVKSVPAKTNKSNTGNSRVLDCPTGQCPLIPKQAPAVAKPLSLSKPTVQPRAYYTPPRRLFGRWR